jgi:hypothetical protein
MKTVFKKNLDRKMKRLYKAIKKLEIIDTNSPILINATIIDSEKLHSIGVINGGFNTCSEIISCSVVRNKDFSNNRKFKIIEICGTEEE